MSKLLYKTINPIVKTILRSPLHGLMSRNTLLLEFTGRKSGRKLATPISYHIRDGAAHCMTSRQFAWWRNLKSDSQVGITLKGKVHHCHPVVEDKDTALIASALTAFLRAVPRDAPHSGVRLDTNGIPNAEDVRRAAQGMIYLKFPLESNHGERI
jgi:hypothetical protein